MEENKGRYLRSEHDPDDDLRAIGVNIRDRTKDIPVDTETEASEDDAFCGFWENLKYPALFLSLVIGIGACEVLGLMSEIIAVPGMCVCAACFGWNARCR